MTKKRQVLEFGGEGVGFEAMELGAGLVVNVERLLLGNGKHRLVVKKFNITNRLKEQI